MFSQIISTSNAIDRTEATRLLSLVCLAVLLPISLISFYLGQLLLASSAVVLSAVFSGQLLLLQRTTYVEGYKRLLLIPSLILFFSLQTYSYGITAAFWFYPLVMIIFILVSLKHALFNSFVLFAVNLPLFFERLDMTTALRLSVSLVLIGIFCIVFLSIIRAQKIKIIQNEQLRDEQKVNTSHELKNSLTTMLAKIEAMKDGIRPVNQTNLSSLLDSNQYLAKLVADLKLLSLADVKDLKLNKERVNLNNLIKDSVDSFTTKATAQNKSLQANLMQQVYLNIDPLRIKQVIDNLLSNSIKYSSPQAQIVVSITSDNEQVMVNVEDSGPGVSDEVIASLFERFYREDKDSVRQKNGSGLGLSIVKSLVEMHNGSVTAFQSPLGGLGIEIRLANSIQRRAG